MRSAGWSNGLSPRAYRKEITKGVDDLAERIKLVDEANGARSESRLSRRSRPASRPTIRRSRPSATSRIAEAATSSWASSRATCTTLARRSSCRARSKALDGHSSVLEKVRMRSTGAGESAFRNGVSLRDGGGGLACTAHVVPGAAGAGILAKLSGLGGAGTRPRSRAREACRGVGLRRGGVGRSPLPGSPDTRSRIAPTRSRRSPRSSATCVRRRRRTVGGSAPPHSDARTPARQSPSRRVESSAQPPDARLEYTRRNGQELGVESAAQPARHAAAADQSGLRPRRGRAGVRAVRARGFG